MLDRLAGLVLRKPKSVLVGMLVLMLVGGAVSTAMTGRLTMGGYDDGHSESAKAAAVLDKTFKQGEPNFALLVTDPRGIDDPAVTAAGTALTQRLQHEKGIGSVGSYWTLDHSAALRSIDHKQALVLGTITGNFDDQLKRVKTLAPSYQHGFQGLEIKVGGSAMAWNENIKTATQDVGRADTIVFPLLMIILILIFGSLIAAVVPLAVTTPLFAARSFSAAALAFGTDPSASASSYSIWRCRLLFSTKSLSMSRTKPTPARTIWFDNTVPRAPMPTMAMREAKSLACPSSPMGANSICLE